jgi:hypothetical protein
MEHDKKAGFPVRGWNPELGIRFGKVIERVGGLTQAAEIADVNPDQVARWRDGKSRAPFHGVFQLCGAAGIHLEWFATGHGPMENDQRAASGPGAEEVPLKTDKTALQSLGSAAEEPMDPMDIEVLLMVLAGTLGNIYAEKAPVEAANKLLRRYRAVSSIRRHLQRQGALDPQIWAEILELAGISSCEALPPTPPKGEAHG